MGSTIKSFPLMMICYQKWFAISACYWFTQLLNFCLLVCLFKPLTTTLATPSLWLFLIPGWREIKSWNLALAKKVLAKDQSSFFFLLMSYMQEEKSLRQNFRTSIFLQFPSGSEDFNTDCGRRNQCKKMFLF